VSRGAATAALARRSCGAGEPPAPAYNGYVRDPKSRPNHAVYLRVLRRMSPEARLRKAFELSAFARALFRTGLRRRFSHLTEPELERLIRDRLRRCHNRIS
jgi:hypothetical protein